MNNENNNKQEVKAKENDEITIFNFRRKLTLTQNTQRHFWNLYEPSNGGGGTLQATNQEVNR